MDNYSTVAALQSAHLPAGKVVYTKGRITSTDGFGATWLIKTIVEFTDTPDGAVSIQIANGNIAHMIIDGSIHSGQVGGTPAVIYVDPTGSDTGRTGLDPAAPLATPQAAANVLAGFGAYLAGRWEVRFAAGTYTGGFELDTATQSDYPIDVFGPTAGHPNVPTAIFDMTTDASGSGVRVANYSWVRATDIKVINATTGSGAEVNNALLSLTNFHTDNCLKACTNLHMGFVSVRGGDWGGNSLAGSVGYSSFYSSTHDFTQASNDASTDALVIHDFERNMVINEGVQGHLDNVNLLNATVANLNIKRGAGAVNTKTMKIDGAPVGVLAENNAWYDNGIVFGSISPNTVNIKTVGNSPELIRRTSTREFFGNRLPAFNVAAHTGTVTKTTIHSFDTFPKEFMQQVGHTFWGELEISQSNVSAVDAVIEIAFGTTQLAFVNFPNTASSGIIKFSGGILSEAGSNNVVTTMEYLDRDGNTDYTPALDTIDMGSADRQLNLRVTLGGTSDSITVRLGRYGTTVGG